MSMFDVARYLSYSNSIDHSKSEMRIFSLRGIRSELGLSGLIEVGHDEALSGKRVACGTRERALVGHFPVMLEACVDALVWQPDGCYVDGTVGGGGHTEAILHRLSAEGSLIGLIVMNRPLLGCRRD